MRILFIDTNILVDLLLRRMPFYNDAVKILNLRKDHQVGYCCSALSFPNVHFQIKKKYTEKESRLLLENLSAGITFISLSENIVRSGFKSDFNDFEDSLQYLSALEAKADYIITRNKKDFKKSKIPVMAPDEFLAQLHS